MFVQQFAFLLHGLLTRTYAHCVFTHGHKQINKIVIKAMTNKGRPLEFAYATQVRIKTATLLRVYFPLGAISIKEGHHLRFEIFKLSKC